MLKSPAFGRDFFVYFVHCQGRGDFRIFNNRKGIQGGVSKSFRESYDMNDIFYVVICFLILAGFTTGSAGAEDNFFENLQQFQKINDFEVENIYLNGRDEAFGARFVHRPTGFTMDIFNIQSVPQGFVWVNTPPRTDMGEPHTCEHLVLGKGNRGRYVASLEDMSLGNSTAYTSQIYTAYPFSSQGGNDIFYDLFEAKVDALCHPNFTDEEISREVCHIGVMTDPETGRLQLEEKGTVYTEMVSSFEKHWYHMYGKLDEMLYGEDHVLSNISGGHPAALREMTPADLWKFHSENYRLDNMGMITCLPDDMLPTDFLNQTNDILLRIGQVEAGTVTPRRIVNIPPPNAPASPGTNAITTYPGSNANDPGHMAFAWPPVLNLDSNEKMMMEVFLYCFAGGQTSNLYNRFINSETRTLDVGANRVWGGVSDDPGNAVTIGLSNVNNDEVNPGRLESVTDIVLGELKRLAQLPPDSEELKEFNERARSRLAEVRKNSEEYLNSPPGFGLRSGGGGGWYSLIHSLEKKPGFKKSLLQKEELEFVQDKLNSGENIWAEYINKWKLLENKPYGVGCKPEPEMLGNEAAAKEERLDNFTKQLMEKYGVATAEEAISLYKKDFDAKTAELDSIAALAEMPEFLENPPLTFDPQLDYKVEKTGGKVPLVVSNFRSMTSSTCGLALDLKTVPENRLIYVPLLPDIITDIGVVRDGKPVPYAEMQKRLQNEVLSFSSYIDCNPHTGRVELTVRGAGSNARESLAALEWIKYGLFNPYLDIDNLSRIRDVVNRNISGLRSRMKGSEEGWVDIPVYTYLYQNNELVMAGYSFLTQEHFLHRIKWRLTDPGDEMVSREVSDMFDALASGATGQSLENLIALASDFTESDPTRFEGGSFGDFVAAFTLASGEAQDIIGEALSDLSVIMPKIPAANSVSDWTYLVRQMKNDLMYQPTKVLKDIADVLALVRNRNRARFYMISNEADRLSLLPMVEKLVDYLSENDLPDAIYKDQENIVMRLKSRHPELNGRPTYMGLINDDTRNGLFHYTAPLADIFDSDGEALLDFLAARLYGGGGAHSMFMKTWSAGLAYSNGLRAHEVTGRLIYYAERCPDLSATMRFVTGELKKVPYDARLANYAVAQAFYTNRSSNSFVSRGIAMASDLADGITSEQVAAFRTRILELKKRPDLYDQLHQRMERVYGKVLIGYGDKLGTVAGGNFFIIGPEAQFVSVENLIASSEGEQPVYRLYPRDFWLVD